MLQHILDFIKEPYDFNYRLKSKTKMLKYINSYSLQDKKETHFRYALNILLILKITKKGKSAKK